jgi:aryl-alcohol dehydrogenase-like predicted oxidoreductase
VPSIVKITQKGSMMKQRQLGKGGPMVGEVGFGAMSIAGAFGPTDDATSHKALAKALDLGVTHIDTALIYGPYRSEEIIGAFLLANPAAKARFSIATKGGIRPDPRGVVNDAKFMRECLEGSLKRLGVEHVDLYYIHRRDPSLPIEDVMEIMLQFRKEGKIGGIGFSEIAPTSLERAAKLGHVRAVQSEYSLWTRLPELGLLQACKRLGTAFVAFSPVARGVLSDVTLDAANFPDKDFRKPMPRFQPGVYQRNLERAAAFKAFAKARGWPTAALANAWVLSRGDHIIPIPGTRHAEHLAENAAASDIHLSSDDIAVIDTLLPVGWAEGNRYSDEQQKSSELYC